MIHVYDPDPRQVTDAANYPFKHGSFSTVAINLNEGLKKINKFAPMDEAEWVGQCSSLDVGFRYRGKKNFLINVWEASSLPIFVLQSAPMHQDKLFGLSNQITNLWHRYGVSQVKTVYGGCDYEFWKPSVAKNPNQFQFLHVNSSNVRSALDVTIPAFSQAFAGNQDVCLVIEDTNPNGNNSTLYRRIEEHRLRYDVDIQYNSRREFSYFIRDLYSASHVTLNVLRATSFGMPLLESSACRSLCVTGDISPLNELIRPEYGVLVPASGMVSIASMLPKLVNEWGLLNCYGGFQHVEEPYFATYKVEDYAAKLSDIYRNWAIYSQIETRQPIIENWSWERAARCLATYLYETV